MGCSFTNSQNLSLKISGINSNETRIIDSISYKTSFINYKLLNDEINDTQKKLQNLGYIETKLIKTSRTNDSVFNAIISLKQKFYTIYIYYDKNLISEELIKDVSLEYNEDFFIVSITQIESSLKYINSKLSSEGLPFAKFNLRNIEKKDEKNLKAELFVNENSERSIDNIIIKGYDKFPKSFIKHFLKIKTNQLFDLKKVKEKTELLNDLSFSNQIKSPEVLFTKDSTTLYLYLKKSKSNTFDGFLGFGTNEVTNKIEFDGYLNLNLINNLNYGEEFNLLYKSDENDQKTFNANLTLPYLFGLPIGAELKLNIFKKDSTFTTVNQNAKIFYQINSKQKFLLGIKAVQSNNLLNENTFTNIEDYKSTFYVANYNYNKFKFSDLLFPVDFVFDISFGFGNRTSNFDNEQQFESTLAISKIINLDNKNSFYIQGKGNALLSNSYFTNELYRFGGINSIRGFEENSILANYYGLINFEYRYRLNSGIYIHSITDVAYFENQITNSKEKLFGLGIGFGILTKAGLLKLNYANGRNENQKFELSNSKIHISLNATF